MKRSTAPHRVRAFGYVFLAGVYFYYARILAEMAARGLSSGAWTELVSRTLLLFLLLFGYGSMSLAFDRRSEPIRAMGLGRRPGWAREFALGAALGWGMLTASILPMVLNGGMVVTIWAAPHQFLLLVSDVLLLAVASLAEEVVFRGYPFQKLIEAVGPFFATVLASLLFGLLHLLNPGANRMSTMVAILAGWLLSAAYLRTRALWICWGWHFAWNASMCLLFGLPLSGITSLSPVVQSSTIGADWLTGSDYGPEGSLTALAVMLAGIVVLHRITREYAHKYAQPVIVPAGLPVDVEALNRAHVAEAPAAAPLVQIAPAAKPAESEPPAPSGDPAV